MDRPISRERALLYERYRLPYPDEVVPDILRHTGTPVVVADIGAGTGQLARAFAGVASTVYAVEPEPAMREVGSQTLGDLKSITFVAGTAEQTNLAEDSVDLIVIGNAYHRFKDEAQKELLRILKPAGWIAIMSYRYVDRSFTDALFSRLCTIDDFTSKSSAAWHNPSTDDLFGDAKIFRQSYMRSVIQDWEGYFGVARSGIESPERDECWFPQFEEINREVFGMFSTNEGIERRYETTVIVGRPDRGQEIT